jgi:Raf kinase inhibitor-like YbhB/YbcL family protein
MLEHVPRWLGALMTNVRAGHAKLAIVQEEVARDAGFIDLSSPAFANGGRLAQRFTADGEGVSPPLIWGEVPAGTVSLVLLVEDPDAPVPNPLVHALVWNLPPTARRLAEGEIVADGIGGPDGRDVGRNSYFLEGWLPPDPPPGHGVHDYVFQLFALSEAIDVDDTPGRSEVIGAISGRVLAAGMLVGTYSRDEPVRVDRRSEAAIPAAASGIAPA